MLNVKSSQAGSSDWHSYYDGQICRDVNIDPKGKFIAVGIAPEPQNAWNQESGHFDGPVESQGYWVAQNYKDENGRDWFQNPVMVLVDGKDAKKIQFGSEVVFVGLAGYYSRKKHSYSFRADEIKEVTK